MKNLIYCLFVFVSMFLYSCEAGVISSEDASGENVSISGSYATILSIGNRMYAVNKTTIFTFDISNPKNPVKIDQKEVGTEIESLYYYDKTLLIGSANNMFIYLITENGIPISKSQVQYNQIFNEGCASDPIVARDKIAYVTLSSTQIECFRNIEINQLRTYNIEDIEKPIQLGNLPLTRPKGLALGKSKLFVCDEVDGLVVIDITDPKSPIVENKFTGYAAYDAIVKGNILMIVTNNSLIQYDITDEKNITLLSTLKLQ
jgi:hypothetical protein